MKLRCPGRNERTFLCQLNEGHAGPCESYHPPDVDQWRAMQSAMRAAHLQGYLSGFKAGVAHCRDDAPDIDAQVIAAVQRERGR